MLITVSGRIIAMALACALVFLMPRNFSIHGTATVPPPEPKSPLQSPTVMPITANFKYFFKFHHPILILGVKGKNIQKIKY